MEELVELIATYRSLGIHLVHNHEKFSDYAITAHSTRIEGSTLSTEEANLLLDKGLTPKGKPLAHSLMVQDHFKALQLTKQHALDKTPISVEMIQQINAAVMQNTWGQYSNALGTVDAAKGEFRHGQVVANDHYFPNFQKVPALVSSFIADLNQKLEGQQGVADVVKISFLAHFDLVNIHPFYDGNGRTSRLLMNLIQHRFDLPLSYVLPEDKGGYIQSIRSSLADENSRHFIDFMTQQYSKGLQKEIDAFKAAGLG